MVNRPSGSVNRKSGREDKARTWAEWILAGTERLRAAGSEAPRREAEELLAHVLRRPRAQILAECGQRLSPRTAARFRALLARRARHIPLQYLLGAEDFAGLRLEVGPGVLIPRPETELLVDEAVRLSPCANTRLLADLGTGSGNLALALAMRFPRAEVYATDLSPRALYWARRNRRRYGLSRAHLLQGRAGDPIPARLHGAFDLVVSNPPYIPRAELSALQPEVRREPRLALDGGPSGLAAIQVMAEAASELLRPGGVFICEIGIGEEVGVRALLAHTGFTDLHVKRDWQDIPRIVSGRR